MTVMCRLVRSRTLPGSAKVLSSFVFQRNKCDLIDAAILQAAIPRQPLSAKNKHTDKPVESKPSMHSKYLPYLDMLNRRRDEAKRSIVVEIEGINDSGGLRQFCEKVGPVNKYFRYRASGKNFVLVEFKTEKAKSYAVKSALHSKDPLSIPVTSPFLYFHHLPVKASGASLPDYTSDIQCSEEKTIQELQNLDCTSNERLATDIDHLHKKSEISDLSVRLRFFTCHQLDIALEGLFNGVRALPFGSSVSGFGRNTGDLDIFLQFQRNVCIEKPIKSQLFFHSKAWVRDKNLQLKLIGDLISVMLPGCTAVSSIFSARVPIVKYRQTVSNLECDLQNSCPSGVDLSHILWLMKHWDARVAPLVYTLRIWAAHNNVCSVKRPSPLLTNFAIMMMAIFYLQRQHILPSLHSFRGLSDKITIRSVDPNSSLVFPDLRKLNSDMLGLEDSDVGVDTLLFGFFDFYSKFDFQKDQVSIYHGKIMPKISNNAVEIENPANANLNISGNVKHDGLQAFSRAVKAACSALGKNSYKSQSVKVLLRSMGSQTGVNLEARSGLTRFIRREVKYT